MSAALDGPVGAGLTLLCDIACAGLFAGGATELLLGAQEAGLARALAPHLGKSGSTLTRLELQ